MATPDELTPNSGAKIFISYSRKDIAFVDQLEKSLKDRGFEPLIDRSEIYAFEDWWERLKSLIAQCDTIVFVLSPDSVISSEAQKEVQHGASLHKRFAPIVARRVDENLVPEALRRLNFVFFDDPTQFAASADRLAEALHTDIGWIRLQTEYSAAATGWIAADRAGGLLLRSPALEEAERWIATRPANAPVPTAETQEFIAASRRGASRRRNILSGALAAGLVLALALAGAAYWQRSVAVEQRQIADQQRKRAEDTLEAATDTANKLVFDLAQRFRNTSGIPAGLVKDILGRAQALQEQLIKSGAVSPELKQSEAVALDEMAQSLLSLGDTQGALEAEQQAVQITSEIADANPEVFNNDAQATVNVLAGFARIGQIFLDRGQLDDALAIFNKRLSVDQELLKADPEDSERQHDLAFAYSDIALVLDAQGKFDEAMSTFRQGLAIQEKYAKNNPDNAHAQADLSSLYVQIGAVQQKQGNVAEAIASNQTAVSILKAIVEKEPDNLLWQHDLSMAYDNLGRLHLTQPDTAAAVEAGHAALAIVQKLVKADPTNNEWQATEVMVSLHLGGAERLAGLFDDALASLQAVLDLANKLVKTDAANTHWQSTLATLYGEIGNVQYRQGDMTAAAASYRTGSNIVRQLVKARPDDNQVQDLLAELYGGSGKVALAQDKADQALQLFGNQVAALKKEGAAIDNNTLALAEIQLGSAEQRHGDLAQALASYQDGLAASQNAVARASNKSAAWGLVAALYENVGGVQLQRKALGDALSAYQSAVQLLENDSNGVALHDLALGYTGIADVQSAQGDADAAIAAQISAVDAVEKAVATDPSQAGWAHYLAASYQKLGDLQAAQDLPGAILQYGKAVAVLQTLTESQAGNKSWQIDLANASLALGQSQAKANDWNGALVSYEGELSALNPLADAGGDSLPYQRQRVIVYGQIAQAQAMAGKLDDARATFEKQLAALPAIAAAAPSDSVVQDSFVGAYETIGMIETAQSHWQQALENYQSALTAENRLLGATPDNTDRQCHSAVLQIRLGSAQSALGNWQAALASIDSGTHQIAARPDNALCQSGAGIAAQALSATAYRLVLARDNKRALQAVDAALAISPGLSIAEGNRAHALMFLGRTDEARQIYEKYKGVEVSPGKLWEDMVREDFSELRKAGLVNPIMAQVEAEFSNGNKAAK
jgi:tetratricopeptide (TPR) repeat protein